MARTNPLLDRLEAYPATALTQRRARLEATGQPVFDFGLGDPELPTPPFIRAALCGAVGVRSQYPSVRGQPPVREAIAGYLRRRFGVDLDPEASVLPTSGSKEAVFHLPLMVIDAAAEDRLVVFPDPSYPAYQRGALFAGGEALPVPLGKDWRFRPWELPEEVLRRTRLLFVNTPHNPSGTVTSLDELARIHALCRAWDILLVSDECYADIHDGTPPPSLLQVAQEGVLVVHSLSKRSGMTGYRSGFLAGDPQWIQRLAVLRANPGVAAQDFVNEAARVAWSDDAHAEERRREFVARRRFMRHFLEAAGFEVAAGAATFYLWFHAPPGHDDLSYTELLTRVGIIAAPGRMFACTDAAHGWIRLALCPDLPACQRAVEAWRTLL